jgi:hypothetical protein
MTWVKKISTDWHPDEWRSINVGEVMDFPAPVDQLLKEGKIVLCDEFGKELLTEKVQDAQEDLTAKLKEEQQELIAEVEKLKQETPEVDPEVAKRKAWAAKMAAARAAKKAAKKK